MSDESIALVAIQERSVDFHGDEILATLVESDSTKQVYIPLRPICDYLGLSWSCQRERVNRDLVLSQEIKGVRVTRTPDSDDVRPGGSRTMLCLPLDFLNGWLFGINNARVKEAHQEKIIQYQRDCYRILA